MVVKKLLKGIFFLNFMALLMGCDPTLLASLGLDSLFAEGATGGQPNNLTPLSLSVSSTPAVITNPEPTSMLLMGGGMAALAYFKRKKR